MRGFGWGTSCACHTFTFQICMQFAPCRHLWLKQSESCSKIATCIFMITVQSHLVCWFQPEPRRTLVSLMHSLAGKDIKTCVHNSMSLPWYLAVRMSFSFGFWCSFSHERIWLCMSRAQGEVGGRVCAGEDRAATKGNSVRFQCSWQFEELYWYREFASGQILITVPDNNNVLNDWKSLPVLGKKSDTFLVPFICFSVWEPAVLQHWGHNSEQNW